ncbi:DUF4145 domain-containing protein [Microbulbifer elongatus]|uniref:DUF4145 domain-containing protein n=1 Tax=Microbulbifer elongatus TaxID=86173 RepID=UPI001CFE860D|nr:DUF4145 domain-containing protein [Microbulbifer elongatus]
MDRTVFKLPFTRGAATRYQCPSCSKGGLVIVEDSFSSKETKASRDMHDHPAWGPEYYGSIYSGILECSNAACKEVVSSSGYGWDEEEHFYDEDGNPDCDYVSYFRPVVFHPHLRPFPLPKGLPEDVEKEINKSFSLIFTDPPSSANHIRIALEHLLTYLKVKRFTTNNGKRYYLSLHKRIDILPAKYDGIKDIFLAVKWLGNAGSHSNHNVTLDDVLDSYELTIELLDEIFSKKRKQAQSLAKKINKRKGPK